MLKLNTLLATLIIICSTIYSRRLFPKTDETTQSNYLEMTAEHVHLDFEPDFSTQIIKGTVKTKFVCKNEPCFRIILDIKDMDILSVHEAYTSEVQLTYKQFTNYSHSDALEINLSKELLVNEEAYIVIDFIHKKGNPSVTWLSNANTDSGEFLYTITKPINARALFPCMDSPIIKSTFSAVITVPKTMKTVFSGVLVKTKAISDKVSYHFHQTIHIPAYLTGFVVGNIEMTDVSERVKIVSEPHKLPKAIKHLNDIDTYLNHAENYLTKFEWGRLSLVIMPKGFPHSGIGQANLIMLSQNILDQDTDEMFYQMLHEIISSWVGNLITHSCWKHAWLTKGLSTYLERKIIYEVEGKDNSEIHKNIGEIELTELIEELGENHKHTALTPSVEDKNAHPDEFHNTKLASEKGYSFFSYLDQGVGRHVLRQNIQKLINSFKKYSINNVDFAAHYIEDIRKVFPFKFHTFLGQIDWDDWIYKTGSPLSGINYFSDTLEDLTDIINQVVFLQDTSTVQEKMSNMPFIAKSVLLKRLNKMKIEDEVENNESEDDRRLAGVSRYMNQKENPNRHLDRGGDKRLLQVGTVKKLVDIFELIEINSYTTKFELILLGLKSKVDKYKELAAEFISSCYQVRYLKPMFRELASFDFQFARKIFLKEKGRLLKSTQKNISEVLNKG